MRIARVFGSVTLSRSHPSFVGARLKLAVPLTLANLVGQSQATDDEVVVWDELGAGERSLIALSEGAEAAQPFRPEIKPVDAYAAALIDRLDLV
jgi:ethanolamine utilization protein EutN